MRRRLAALTVTLVATVAACGSATVPVPYATGPVAAAGAAPVLGWNSWNELGCTVDEAAIRATADAMATNGMAAAGYRYVTLDDCWVAAQRASDGSLVADATRFPSGIAALAAYVHGKGLLFGLYSSPGPMTCMQRAGLWPGSSGSQGHEAQDARTFAAWGVDLLKYDLCTPESSMTDPRDRFDVMGAALRATGRPIVYSINPNSFRADAHLGVADWSTTASMWRIGFDVIPAWTADPATGLVGILDAALATSTAALADRSGPGHRNDPDMLVVGVDKLVGGIGTYASIRQSVTPAEARTNVALWSMLAAPLVAGADLRTITATDLALLTDPQLVAVDQDPSPPAALVHRDDATAVWRRTLSDGRVATLTVDLATHASTLLRAG